MKLYIKDRIILLGILPQKTMNYKTFNLKKNLVKEITITEEDKEKYEIKQDEKTEAVTWNPNTDRENPIEIKLTNDLAEYLKGVCEEVSEKEFPEEVWQVIERIFDEIAQYTEK